MSWISSPKQKKKKKKVNPTLLDLGVFWPCKYTIYLRAGPNLHLSYMTVTPLFKVFIFSLQPETSSPGPQ